MYLCKHILYIALAISRIGMHHLQEHTHSLTDSAVLSCKSSGTLEATEEITSMPAASQSGTSFW